ncbi:MAG: S1/P1 nuclease [Candidatus Acidiferrum sp.]
MKRMAVHFVLLGLSVGFVLAPSARAWGCKGHQTVALIAEKHLTPETREWVQKLLSENPIDPKLKRYCGDAMRDAMADAATWADDVRGERKNGPWHYIDIPRGSKRGPLEPYCEKAGCVTSAISEQLAILKDKSTAGEKRADALRYVIHFVGDLHQPMHTITNADEGGNCVPLNYLRRKAHQHNHWFSPNLHNIWDSAIIERDAEGADSEEYADTLNALFTADIAGWEKAGIHVDDWVWEGYSFAESVSYGDLTPQVPIEPNVPVHSCSDDNNIGERMLHLDIVTGEAYQEQAAPVAEKRIAEGGVRLAMILNETTKAIR